MKIITIGSATLDVYLESSAFKEIKSKDFSTGIGECLSLGSKNEVNNIFVDTGGGATNAAVTFANFGIRVSVASRIGDDLFGREILKVLKDKKIGLEYLQKDIKHQTSYSTLLLLSGGQRSILVYRGASNYLTFSSLFKDGKRVADWFYITSLGGNLKLLGEILNYAKKNKIKVAYNPGQGELKYGLKKINKYIKMVEVFNLNREEAALLCNLNYEQLDEIKKKLNAIAPNIIITDGPAGAYVLSGGNDYFADSLGTKPKNTTGAGDAFGSAFLAGIVIKNNIDFALRLAILNSDGVIREMGAKNGLLKGLPNESLLKKVKIKKEII